MTMAMAMARTIMATDTAMVVTTMGITITTTLPEPVAASWVSHSR
ncbi:MAG TPA: hypothetical protein VGE08_16490 [Steroidobacter sp.]